MRHKRAGRAENLLESDWTLGRHSGKPERRGSLLRHEQEAGEILWLTDGFV